MRTPAALLKRCAGLLKSPPDTQLRAGEEIHIPLRPLPLARLLGAATGAGMLACITQLLFWHQLLLALALLVISLVAALILHRTVWLHGGAVWLQLDAGGQFRVYCRDGRVEPVGMRPQSLRVGGGVLLVLRGTRTYRLWLAQGNVGPGVLAALHRRLGRGSAGMTGLR